jgi:serine protease Do
MGAGAVIAVCLVCAILGGLCGGAIVGTVYRPDTQQVEAAAGENTEENTVINKVSPNTTVSTNLVSSGGVISPSTIYSMACTQAVAITTEITYTNFLGYTSSGAVSGSGFIISSNGYILTNYHVIQQAVEGGYDVNVYLYDGTEYVATVVGYEQDNDVAVLKIDVDNLDPVTIGDSDSIDVGESVYAVGNPLGELEYTMTTGTVSALNRDISSTDSSTGTTTTINMFQIDAAVNSGNSGGPVYNSRGEVIGIVTAKYSSSGVEGLGFAIPINDAISIANELITNGYVSGKAYLGVMVETVNSIAVRYYNMVPGAYVYGVESGSCAEAAGIKVGDVIVALDDTQITSMGDLTTAKKAYSAGSSAVVKVYRNGEYVELPIVFDEEVPSNSSSEQSSDNSGFDGGFGSQRP